MGRLLIITYAEWSNRLKMHLEGSWGNGCVDTLCIDRSLFDDEPFDDINKFVRLYSQISYVIDSYPAVALRDLTILFTLQVHLPAAEGDAGVLYEWNPLLLYEKERGRPHPRSLLLSWIVLSYPEIRWIFLSEESGTPKDFLREFHSLAVTNFYTKNPDIVAFTDSYVALFDFTGFRNLILTAIETRENKELAYRDKDKEVTH